jgi:hypothetical protein
MCSAGFILVTFIFGFAARRHPTRGDRRDLFETRCRLNSTRADGEKPALVFFAMIFALILIVISSMMSP